MNYTIEIFETENGRLPFQKWLDALLDRKARVAIELRIDRLGIGNFGAIKSLGGGLYELKIDVGPGYRVYMSKVGKTLILLLCAGSKKTQQKDITKAREYLKSYKLRG